MRGVKRGPVLLFYSYSHTDERLRTRLEAHLSPLKREKVIEDWHDRKITAGDTWADEIDEHVETAAIIVPLISADFIASDYCWGKEMARALERHQNRSAWLIPVIVKPVDWNGTPFGRLQALPKDGKPVTLWPNREAAWLDVAKGIRKVAEALTSGVLLDSLRTSAPQQQGLGGAL